MVGDTSVDAQARRDEVVRGLTPGERLAMVVESSEAIFAIAEAGIRMRHPDYSDDEVRLTGIRIRIGDDLYRAAFPTGPLLPT